MTVDQLFEQGFDAIFIGTGTALSKELDLPGKDLQGIVQSSYFLRTATLCHEGELAEREVPVEKGEKVLVIGAGNVAMDAARTAVRLGASSVGIVYRRTVAEMTALQAEYEAALAEGVEFHWQTSPKAYVGEAGRLTGLEVEQADGVKVLPADKVLLAIGSRPAARIVSSTTGIEVQPSGYVITKEKPYGMTTRQGVFAGGDVVHQPATVVLAMKEAKKVAQGIAAYVRAVKLLQA